MNDTASSTLASVPAKGLTYSAANVLDGNDQTAWSQDRSHGGAPTEGSWLRLSSTSALDVDQITVVISDRTTRPPILQRSVRRRRSGSSPSGRTAVTR